MGMVLSSLLMQMEIFTCMKRQAMDIGKQFSDYSWILCLEVLWTDWYPIIISFFLSFRTKKGLVILYSLSSRTKLNFLLHMPVTVRYIDMVPKLIEKYSCYCIKHAFRRFIYSLWSFFWIFLESFSTFAWLCKIIVAKKEVKIFNNGKYNIYMQPVIPCLQSSEFHRSFLTFKFTHLSHLDKCHKLSFECDK